MRLTSDLQGNTIVLLQDAFKGLSYWNNFMTGGEWSGVAMDTHIYQMFSNDEVSRSDDEHITVACSQGSALSSLDRKSVV